MVFWQGFCKSTQGIRPLFIVNYKGGDKYLYFQDMRGEDRSGE